MKDIQEAGGEIEATAAGISHQRSPRFPSAVTAAHSPLGSSWRVALLTHYFSLPWLSSHLPLPPRFPPWVETSQSLRILPPLAQHSSHLSHSLIILALHALSVYVPSTYTPAFARSIRRSSSAPRVFMREPLGVHNRSIYSLKSGSLLHLARLTHCR